MDFYRIIVNNTTSLMIAQFPTNKHETLEYTSNLRILEAVHRTETVACEKQHKQMWFVFH